MQALVTQFQPLDELESQIIESWRHVSQATCRFLSLLREFDLRHGWKAWGCADCADWLNLKCGITRNTAQEKLRVAKALWHLPQIEEAFKRGHLSYSKVRALTRVATEPNEADLLEYALDASAAQVERYCRRLRNGSLDSTADARRAHASRSLSRSFREDGTALLTVELPTESMGLVLAALERVAKTLPDLDESDATLFTRGADALVEMARGALSGDPQSPAGEQHQVIVHVDASALSNQGGQSDLPVESVRRLCCDGSLVPISRDDSGNVLSVGRKTRVVPTAIRRALEARDRHCSFPGCTHDRWIDAHHVHHWADGGETSLENLVLLCSHHHRLVHEGGFEIRRWPDGTLYFVRPDGRPVEARASSACRNHQEVDGVADVRAVYKLRRTTDAPLSAESGARRHAADAYRGSTPPVPENASRASA